MLVNIHLAKKDLPSLVSSSTKNRRRRNTLETSANGISSISISSSIIKFKHCALVVVTTLSTLVVLMLLSSILHTSKESGDYILNFLQKGNINSDESNLRSKIVPDSIYSLTDTATAATGSDETRKQQQLQTIQKNQQHQTGISWVEFAAAALPPLPFDSFILEASTTNTVTATRKPPDVIPAARKVHSMPISEFAAAVRQLLPLQLDNRTTLLKLPPELNTSRAIAVCPAATEERLQQPQLTAADASWCRWALLPLNAGGAAVRVGSSWGALRAAADRAKFDALNCNAVGGGKLPTCADAWGDQFVRQWQRSPQQQQQCTGRSSMRCFLNDSKQRFCVLDRVLIDFNKYETVARGGSGTPPSKSFAQDFMSLDCLSSNINSSSNSRRTEDFQFPHLLALDGIRTSSSSSSGDSSMCDVVLNGTVLLYSHDNIRNLAHTMNDIMNVWLMLWLSNTAAVAQQQVRLLSVDALRQYNNFGDVVVGVPFFAHYKRNFNALLGGAQFHGKRVCIDRLLVQPLPPKGFVWEGWHTDMPCSFIGPSSLYQRWNLHVRNSLGLLLPTAATDNEGATVASLQQQQQRALVLLIVRSETNNEWGRYRTSRIFLNLPDITAAIESLQQQQHGSDPSQQLQFDLLVQDLSKLSFDEQVLLLARSSVLVGMHGAGIAQSMHMSIGSLQRPCCGVIEIIPKGEFTQARGFGNMARKMGIHHSRIDIGSRDSRAEGALVPVLQLKAQLLQMLQLITRSPSCVLSGVLADPDLLAD